MRLGKNYSSNDYVSKNPKYSEVSEIVDFANSEMEERIQENAYNLFIACKRMIQYRGIEGKEEFAIEFSKAIIAKCEGLKLELVNRG